VTRLRTAGLLVALVLVLACAHGVLYQPSEPFFNNDESRHVMTGVFVRDVLLDLPLSDPRGYTVSYYLQYPALGLLVWPPLFYLIEGLAMLAFGTSVAVSKLLVGLFALTACAYFFLLVSHTHDRFRAAMAVLVFGFSPLVFRLSGQVMLEIPALAFFIAAVYHFVRYLDGQRKRDIWLAAVAAALSVLTRFDAACLTLVLLSVLAAKRSLHILRRREAWLSAGLALLLTVPVIALTAREFGWVHLKTIVQSTSKAPDGFGWAANLFFYPASLPAQIGWFAAVPGIIGLVWAAWGPHRERVWPYLAMAGATYLAFTPLAEREARHAIYWIPAFSVLAVDGTTTVWRRWLPAAARRALAGVMVAGTAWVACRAPTPFVRGYQDAAAYVVAGSADDRFCLFDSFLNGDFIYQVRRADPERRLWVLRGDKILYSTLVMPELGYVEHARGDDEILTLLFAYDPKFIVVEDRPISTDVPAAERLRRLLRTRTDRFRLERTVPLETNLGSYRGVNLRVYRSLVRNPQPRQDIDVEMLGLGRSLQAVLPQR
jgi:hypothetical protein